MTSFEKDLMVRHLLLDINYCRERADEDWSLEGWNVGDQSLIA